jgi:tRNA-2-methylthio-N6-dimethylallyladenosine synthase
MVGRTTEVLVADGEGRKDEVTRRMSGRARDNRLVHFNPGESTGSVPRPGDIISTVVTKAAPHYLLADDLPLTVRRTRGGDVWSARQGQPQLEQPAAAPVLLGMPALGRR